MIKFNVSSKLPAAAWPRPGVSDYVFTVHAFGGQVRGADVREFDWTLQVDARRAMLSVESFRSDGDVPGQPLGIFRQALDDKQLNDFRGAVAASRLGAPRPSMKRHPGMTEKTYALIEPPTTRVEDRINDSDEETNAVLAPLRKKINGLLAGSFDHPERAALPGIKHVRQPSGDMFEVTITNIGIEKICFADPRWIAPGGPHQRAVILVGEYEDAPPGVPVSVDWKPLTLQPMSPRPTSEPLVTLDAQAVWKTTTAPWKRLPGKRYLAYFAWSNYAGDPQPGGVYRIRGRADSERLVVEP